MKENLRYHTWDTQSDRVNCMHTQYLLCGLPAIDVEDWKKNTEYIDYKSTDDTIMWFWIVSSYLPYGPAMHAASGTSSNTKERYMKFVVNCILLYIYSRPWRDLIMRHVQGYYSL